MDEGAVKVALELERLRGSVDAGFATLNGRLDGALQRMDASETDMSKLDRKVDEKVATLDDRLTSLERKIWIAAGAAAVVTGGGMTGIWQLFHR